jgi:XisH protein
MPVHDFYHETVKNALIKDGWKITDDPYTLEYAGTKLYADLGAEKIFAAERRRVRKLTHARYLSHCDSPELSAQSYNF